MSSAKMQKQLVADRGHRLHGRRTHCTEPHRRRSIRSRVHRPGHRRCPHGHPVGQRWRDRSNPGPWKEKSPPKGGCSPALIKTSASRVANRCRQRVAAAQAAPYGCVPVFGRARLLRPRRLATCRSVANRDKTGTLPRGAKKR